MWWVVRGWRPLVRRLPGVLLGCALATATPLVVSAAPAAGATVPPTHCVPAAGPNACAGVHATSAAPAHRAVRRHAVRQPVHVPPAPAPPAASPAAPLLVATFDNNIGVAALVARVVAPAPVRLPGLGIPPRAAQPRLGGVLSVPQPSLFGGGLGPGPGETGAELGVWQVIAGAEGVALLALVAALLRRRRVAGRQDR
jgi:hypothetical protein